MFLVVYVDFWFIYILVEFVGFGIVDFDIIIGNNLIENGIKNGMDVMVIYLWYVYLINWIYLMLCLYLMWYFFVIVVFFL